MKQVLSKLPRRTLDSERPDPSKPLDLEIRPSGLLLDREHSILIRLRRLYLSLSEARVEFVGDLIVSHISNDRFEHCEFAAG